MNYNSLAIVFMPVLFPPLIILDEINMENIKIMIEDFIKYPDFYFNII